MQGNINKNDQNDKISLLVFFNGAHPFTLSDPTPRKASHDIPLKIMSERSKIDGVLMDLKTITTDLKHLDVEHAVNGKIVGLITKN